MQREGGEQLAVLDEAVQVELGAPAEARALDDRAHDPLALQRREEPPVLEQKLPARRAHELRRLWQRAERLVGLERQLQRDGPTLRLLLEPRLVLGGQHEVRALPRRRRHLDHAQAGGLHACARVHDQVVRHAARLEHHYQIGQLSSVRSGDPLLLGLHDVELALGVGLARADWHHLGHSAGRNEDEDATNRGTNPL